MLRNEAPNGQVSEYDREHLPVYADILDADAEGIDWQDGAIQVLRLNATTPPDLARHCWESHLARARWIVGEGLEAAITAFGERQTD